MKKVIAFDLDDTLAESKSAITDRMSDLLGKLLGKYQVMVISGGHFGQFEKQLVSNLKVDQELLANLHLMPTSGTRYLRYINGAWHQEYAEDLTEEEKTLIKESLARAAKARGYMSDTPHGEIIEDRGSQVTFSALGQEAPIDEKKIWDPEAKKRLQIIEDVKDELSAFHVRTGGTTSIDVTRSGIDKAYGIDKIMEIVGVSKEEILFFGDSLHEGGNDYAVKAHGVDSIAVKSWEDTAIAIETLVYVA